MSTHTIVFTVVVREEDPSEVPWVARRMLTELEGFNEWFTDVASVRATVDGEDVDDEDTDRDA